MHVAFLSASGELGGAERSLLDIIASLRDAQPSWALHLIVPAEGPLRVAAAAAGAATEVLPLDPAVARIGEAGSGAARVHVATRLLRAAAPVAHYVRRLRRRLAALSPDVIHTHGLKMHLLAAWANPEAASVVWHLHDYIGRRPSSSMLLRRSVRRCAVVVANSWSVAADALDTLGDQVPIVPILNGVDLHRFSPTGPRAVLDRPTLSVATPALRVGLVATYARWKGHATFLDACARLPRELGVHAYVIGGPLYQTDDSQVSLDELRCRVRDLGLADRVTFTGFLPNTPDVMRALDVVVHASTEPEPFGLVIAEAMACGRALVVAYAGGACELVRPGVDALTHTPGDAESLANAVATLTGDAALRERLGRAARAAAEQRFDRRRLTRELVPVYERAVRRACA